MDKIFKVFDAKNYGNIQIDRMFFLYISLLMAKPNPSFNPQQSSFISTINQSFHYFLQQIDCFSGRVSFFDKLPHLINRSHPDSLKLIFYIIRLIQDQNSRLFMKLQNIQPPLVSNYVRILNNIAKLYFQVFCH